MEYEKENYSFSNTEVNGFADVIICFSHLRWNFVYQRPQHLLTRMAKDAVVYYIEEPVMDTKMAHCEFDKKEENVTVVVPHLPAGISKEEETVALRSLLDQLLDNVDPSDIAFWYYTPMALKFSRHIRPKALVFDCMDELSAFKFAPEEMKDLEQELLSKADIVFTGGASLYKAKKDRHHNIHLFPSSIEKEHFGKARSCTNEPTDQAGIGYPRLGFFGVIDERFDIELIRGMAEQRPDWQIVIIGPVVKIDPESLPRLNNIHYLGGKQYSELPAYVSGWDITLIPFALNESTKFISPTKTPEYLAAGKHVITTPLIDVIEPYSRLGLVSVAANAAGFVIIADKLLEQSDDANKAWLAAVDDFLKDISWDDTAEKMKKHIRKATCQHNYSITQAGATAV